MPHAASLMEEGAPPSSIRLRTMSLGADVQSTTMALLAAHGEIGPMPDCVIFTDTGGKPRGVYEHLRRLAEGRDIASRYVP